MHRWILHFSRGWQRSISRGPSAPRNLLADGEDAVVMLSWDAPENDGGLAITDYEVRINGRGSWMVLSS